jgi:hypothetical protein
MTRIITLVISLIFSVAMFAQNGALTIEVVEANSTDAQVAAQLEMMKGTKISVSYMGEKSLTEMNMMGGLVNIDVKMSENGDMDMYMDMMGQKMWIPSTKAELDLAKAQAGASDPEFVYDESDTKEIAGFECYKVTMTNPDVEGFVLEAYITEEIVANAAVIQGVDISQFKGFPLEYTINSSTPNMNMTFTTTDYTADVDASVFDVKNDGFTKMTMEEFQSLMGGAGGFGF